MGALIALSLLVRAPSKVTSDVELPEDTIASYDCISASSGAISTLGGGSSVAVSGAVSVTGNSFIVFAVKNVDALVNGEWVETGATLNAASVSVAPGSTIDADGRGYLVSGTGLGAEPSRPTSLPSTNGASRVTIT